MSVKADPVSREESFPDCVRIDGREYEYRLCKLDSSLAWEAAECIAAHCDRSAIDGNPWAIPEYFRLVAHWFPRDEPPWMLAINASATGELLGCSFFWIEVQKRKLGTYRVLRSFDQMAFRLPMILAVPGKEVQATRAFAAGLKAIGRAMHVQLWCWYRLDSSLLDDFRQELGRQRLPVRVRLFTESPTIKIGDDFKSFCAGKRNVLADILRRERRMLAENANLVRLRHLWGIDLAGKDGDEAWDLFKHVRSVSWQRQWLEHSGKADVESVESYYRSIAEIWSQRGWLSLQTMEIAEEPAAAQIWLVMPSRTWFVQFAYDRRFQRHGVGNTLLIRSLESWHQNGGRFIEFGGECLGWKSDWANGGFDIFQMELGLGDFRSRLWALGSGLAALHRSLSVQISRWRSRRAGSGSSDTPRDIVRTGHENDL